MNIKKIRSGLAAALLTVATLLLCANVAVLLYGVVTRYLLNQSPFWMDELSRYLIIASVMLVMGVVYLKDAHMRVTVLQNKLQGKLRKPLLIYHWIIITTLSSYVCYISAQYALSVAKFTTIGLGVSKAIPLMALPIGFGLLALTSLLMGPFYHENNKDLEHPSCY
ncbi:TRAP transporter small permease [Marinobacter sp. X15-166B]|uniref:TRAP transporter small permease n=1 Tax=Marinobacter sp. X15-166B TaxID=1897620 RepID=UPI00085BED4E|nr:TRAP transporter small permease [Marinobacter sp. X15-166B]OEY67048.1 TRAP transporter [Marinobacter sp. X15-166B]